MILRMKYMEDETSDTCILKHKTPIPGHKFEPQEKTHPAPGGHRKETREPAEGPNKNPSAPKQKMKAKEPITTKEKIAIKTIPE